MTDAALGSGPIDGIVSMCSGSARRLGLSDLYWLTDEQMARLEPYFPKSHGKPRVS